MDDQLAFYAHITAADNTLLWGTLLVGVFHLGLGLYELRRRDLPRWQRRLIGSPTIDGLANTGQTSAERILRMCNRITALANFGAGGGILVSLAVAVAIAQMAPLAELVGVPRLYLHANIATWIVLGTLTAGSVLGKGCAYRIAASRAHASTGLNGQMEQTRIMDPAPQQMRPRSIVVFFLLTADVVLTLALVIVVLTTNSYHAQRLAAAAVYMLYVVGFMTFITVLCVLWTDRFERHLPGVAAQLFQEQPDVDRATQLHLRMKSVSLRPQTQRTLLLTPQAQAMSSLGFMTLLPHTDGAVFAIIFAFLGLGVLGLWLLTFVDEQHPTRVELMRAVTAAR